MPTSLILDTQNFLHRSRAGFNLGSHAVVYNFFRSFRALLQQHTPNRVYCALEGYPKSRRELYSEYKANRFIEPGSAKHEEMVNFHGQCALVHDLLTRHFPVSVMRHPEWECDDVIYNVVARSSRAIDFVIVSNDSDFVQVTQEFENVRVWNPMKKSFMEAPEYSHIVWKVLRGDGSDNIPGVPGVSDRVAQELASDDIELRKFLSENSERSDLFFRNWNLIKLHQWGEEDALKMTSSTPTRDWDSVKSTFDSWNFSSITKEPAWSKFVSTFDPLFGGMK